MIALIYPAVCLYGKRFHDRGKSAWWVLISLVPILGFIWILIDLGILKGTEGENRFGPDPLGGQAPPVPPTDSGGDANFSPP